MLRSRQLAKQKNTRANIDDVVTTRIGEETTKKKEHQEEKKILFIILRRVPSEYRDVHTLCKQVVNSLQTFHHLLALFEISKSVRNIKVSTKKKSC